MAGENKTLLWVLGLGGAGLVLWYLYNQTPASSTGTPLTGYLTGSNAVAKAAPVQKVANDPISKIIYVIKTTTNTTRTTSSGGGKTGGGGGGGGGGAAKTTASTPSTPASKVSSGATNPAISGPGSNLDGLVGSVPTGSVSVGSPVVISTSDPAASTQGAAIASGGSGDYGGDSSFLGGS